MIQSLITKFWLKKPQNIKLSTALAVCLLLSKYSTYGQGIPSTLPLNSRGIEGIVRLSVQNDSLKKENMYLKNSLRLYELILQNKTQIETLNTQNTKIQTDFIQNDCKPKIPILPIIFGIVGTSFGIYKLIKP